MLEMSPREWLDGKDPGVDGYAGSQENNYWFLASYIMHYGMCAHPNQSKLKKTLQMLSFKKYDELGDGNKDPSRDHKSGLQLITTSDLGYTLWQSLNSSEDWSKKVHDPKLKYTHDAKWTSDRKETPMEDRAPRDAGMKEYLMCLNWARELKKMGDTREYWTLEIKCNEKAALLGYFKEWGKAVKGRKRAVYRESESDDEEVGELVLEEVDGIPEVDI